MGAKHVGRCKAKSARSFGTGFVSKTVLMSMGQPQATCTTCCIVGGSCLTVSTDDKCHMITIPAKTADLITSDLLKSWEEEPLNSATPKLFTTYRLFVSPTFSAPLLFQAVRHDKHWELVGKMKTGIGGYFQGELAWRVKRRLNERESAKLDSLLNDLQFWSMPCTESRRALVDGTSFILEGNQAGQYHIVERSSPTEEPLIELAEYLRVVSGASHYLLSRKGQEQMARGFRTLDEAVNRTRPQQLTLAAIKRLNKIALRLVAQIADRGLRCPHCQTLTKQIRFFERLHPDRSFFVCKVCARSFGPERLLNVKLLRRGAK